MKMEKVNMIHLNDSKERNVRDSPYVSNYQEKSSKRKSKEERLSKESLSRISKKKSGTFKRKFTVLLTVSHYS